ncbi:HD domain-containing phosphohydrolase [Leptolinea tardivitalis]|uniref:HD domain-containing phosphohydrolase n=1 Tax=Leptolinea tardivitalis TaxID=229920 RepID=UPI0007839E05|nr:HD domain-containing phosphohydrolase [Leptolinea tardivitalis]GAP20784.1 protein containing PAS domain S-box [Leptolinea tardivitalis]
MKKFHLDVGIRIPMLYLLFGGLWIIFSDQLLDAFVHNTTDMTRIQSYKGWAFVAASGLLIFLLLRQYLNLQAKIKNQLHESEERLRLAVSAANQGIFDLDVRTGNLVVNDIYAVMLGYDPISFHENVESWLERMHPDDIEIVNEIFKNYIDGKLAEYKVEFRQKTNSGEWKWILSIGQIVERDIAGRPVRLLGTFSDITESKEAEIIRNRLFEDAQRRLKRIASLREIDHEISSTSDFLTTLEKIVQNVMQHLDADAVSILLYDNAEKVFKYAESTGFDTNRIQNARVKMGGSFAGIAAQQRTMLHIRDLENNHIDEAFSSLLREEGIKNYFGMPLISKDTLVGVLELFMRNDINPDKEWLDFYETLAGQAALAIENARLFDGLESANKELSLANTELVAANIHLIEAYDATIESLVQALNLRDYETEDHSRRVSTMMLELSRMMDFTQEEITNIHRGTLLHDIGKMGVPDAILRKPGLLTMEERKIMEQHPIYAFNLLKSIDYLQPALDIPHLHHEKWDGTGYPYGLKGEQIPLSARLFAIVDVYDALSSDRPYRKAWDKEAVFNFIKEQKGKHFDPKVVDVFLEYMHRLGEI